jgi:tetratricopeptide (TPR) repeat protein
VFSSTKRPKEAEASLREALATRKQLVDDFPKRAEFRHELATSHFNLGAFLHLNGKPKEAEQSYRDALAIQEKLVAKSPNVPEYQHGLGATLVNLAILHNQRRDFAKAASLFEQARKPIQATLKINAKNREYRAAFANLLEVQAQNHLARADHVQLAANAEELARFANDPANDTYNAACFLCQCVTLAEKDARLEAAKRKELAGKYADRALALLRQAVERGFKNADHMKKDSDLQPLRERPEFKKLLAELEKPSKK